MIPATGSWSNTGSLGTARLQHTATLLPNGRVLVRCWQRQRRRHYQQRRTIRSGHGCMGRDWLMFAARYGHTATLLAGGQVLVAGGVTSGNLAYGSELYDPAAGTWATNGVLNTGRSYHTATLLANGKVLVVGGLGSNFVALASAELYDPANGTWTNTGSLNIARWKHTATLLPNGQVLVAGGRAPTAQSPAGLPAWSCTIPTPDIGRWTNSLTETRSSQTANSAADGTVLVADGAGTNLNPSAVFYDPASGSWTTATNSPNTWRTDHTQLCSPTDRCFSRGAKPPTAPAFSARELFDSANGAWTNTGPLSNAREISHGNVAIRRESLGNWG